VEKKKKVKKIKKTTKKQTKKAKAPPKKISTKPIKEANEPLTDKEEWLCREFICDYAENQVRAYMHVFKSTNYDSARTESSKFFAKPNIKRRIAELRVERNKRLEISGDRVLAELAKLSFYDPRVFHDSDGRLKPINELDPDQAAVIAGIKTTCKIIGDEKDGISVLTDIKLPDKGANLERLGKHLKLFTEKKEFGFDEKSVELLLAALPPEIEAAVRQKLFKLSE
jgi:phage terminase small subunit